MLQAFELNSASTEPVVSALLVSSTALAGKAVVVSGDISSAFWLVAGNLNCTGSELLIENVVNQSHAHRHTGSISDDGSRHSTGENERIVAE